MNGRLSLLIDADDTLWENNIYFERAFETFCDFLDHSALTPPQVRAVLNEIELVNSKIHGYGSINFGRNLQQAYRHLAEREIRDLKDAAALLEFHKHKGIPWEPADHGFVLSKDHVERFAQRKKDLNASRHIEYVLFDARPRPALTS